MVVFKWRVWCIVEGAHFEVVSATAPADHGGHAIDTNRNVILSVLNADSCCNGAGPTAVSALLQEDEDKPYARIDYTCWDTVGSMEFPGTDAWTPTAMRVILLAEQNPGTHKHYVRLRDVTNNNTVCEMEEVITTEQAVYEETVFSDLPQGAAVLEIQVKKQQSNTKKGRIYHLTLRG